MPSPLTTDQKRTLILDHLRPAFAAAGQAAMARGELWDDTAAGFETWRHAAIIKATGKAGLRCCSQADFTDLVAHCWDLRGRPDIALKLQMAADTTSRNQVEHLIMRELATVGWTIGYAARICRDKCKTTLLEATVKQLWTVFYDVRTRTRAELKHRSARPSTLNPQPTTAL
jgi:hypothetical protein